MPKVPALKFFAKRPIRLTLMVCALALLVYAGHGSYSRYQATHRPQPRSPQPVVVNSTAEPDETQLSEYDFNSSYDVAPDQPRQIILPSIKALGYVQQVGLDQFRNVAVPTNIHLAGWYVDGVVPGDAGVSLIDGHVTGRYRPGVFKNLSGLKPGDTFRIEYGNHSTSLFEVVRLTTLSVPDATKQLLAPDPHISRQLNIITCGGRLDPKTHTYDQRVLVVSRMVE